MINACLSGVVQNVNHVIYRDDKSMTACNLYLLYHNDRQSVVIYATALVSKYSVSLLGHQHLGRLTELHWIRVKEILL